jgi:hypothetical protein
MHLMPTPRSYRVRVRYREKLHPLASVWRGMIRRCHDPKSKGFKAYGARGIKVCNQWRNSYETLYQWAFVNRWRKGLHIHRIDNDGNYCPENCQFLTAQAHRKKHQPLTRKRKTDQRLTQIGAGVKP